MLLVTLRMFYKFVHCIIGHACRFKVVGSLCKKCPTPKEAEAHFLQVSQVSSSSSQSLSQVSDSNDESSLSLCEAAVQTETGVAIQSQRCQTQLSLQPSNGENDELLALSGSFAQPMLEKKISIPGDYLVHSASVIMSWSLQCALQLSQRYWYPSSGWIRFLLPMQTYANGSFGVHGRFLFVQKHKSGMSGEINNNVTFNFYHNNIQVHPCPQDYRLWQQTMYAQFGQKWAKLHHGPLWSVAASDQLDDVTVGKNMKVVYTCILNLRFEQRIFRLRLTFLV